MNDLTLNEYQRLAGRTINKDLNIIEVHNHALSGMVGELGEIHSIYQKQYQGHPFDREHLKKEVGDLLWMIAEFCSANNWQMADVAQENIDKLKARYPENFSVEKSLHRKEGDI